MCIIKSTPDPNGDFIAPARVWQPKSKRSSYGSSSPASSTRFYYTTAEHSPRASTRLALPGLIPAAAAVRPKIVQEIAPPYYSNYLLPAPQPPVTIPPPQAPLVIPPPQAPVVIPGWQDFPQAQSYQTSIREPSRSSSRRSVPPPAPDAPPAAREPRHSRDLSGSRRGRPESRQSSARTPRSRQLSPRPPHRHHSTSTRSRRSDDLGSNYSHRSNRTSAAASDGTNSRDARRDRRSAELPQRSTSRRSTRFLEPQRRRETIVIENKDGTRVRQYYFD